VKLQSVPPKVYCIQYLPEDVIGPACAADPANATKANAENATADAIANL
jgi:hypothetical protein